jgi:hypothetical protein
MTTMDDSEQELAEQELAEPVLDDAFRHALLEIEDYLHDMPDERLVELVLPFASRWTLPQSGLDLVRLREEAELFVRATPLSDRILTGYVDQVAWWLSERMLLGADEQPDVEAAQAYLTTVRAEIEQRAGMVETAGYLRVAAAFRRVREETAGGVPPANLLWRALALRIAESALG